jgi:RNA polymerase sigma factor (TIGR02999 family)
MLSSAQITALIVASSHGNREALDRLVPLVYDQLRALARARLRHERRDHTLDTVALVNEAYLKLVQLERLDWKDRAHFFATASRLMRRILIDHAHRRHAGKRGPRDHDTIEVAEIAAPLGERPVEALLALDHALERLETINPRAARVVDCRCFAGLSLEETAAAVDVSLATAKRDLRFAQAWLAREVMHEASHGAGSSAGGRTSLPRARRPQHDRARRSP